MSVDPTIILLCTSQPLRHLAETVDDVKELKVFLFQLADEFDRLRGLMPTSGCGACEIAAQLLRDRAVASVVPLRLLQAG